MSTYVSCSGSLRYSDKKDLAEAVKILRDGGWMEGDVFVDEAGGEIDIGSPHVDEKDLILTVPFGIYRNLGRVLGKVAEKATDGSVQVACTDGCFELSTVHSGGNEETADLMEFVQDNNLAFSDEDPTGENVDYDDEDASENLHVWQEEVVEHWLTR